MTDSIILICIAVFLPLGLVVANRLLDRTSSKEKDKTISDLTSKVSELMSSKLQAEASSKVAESVSELSNANAETATKSEDLKKEAEKVITLEEALALARKQAEAEKK